MAHKIDAGAVSEYSLVWRDGFEEWRPLAAVPELVALLHECRRSGPPARASFSSMPAFVDSHTSPGEAAGPAAPLSTPLADEDLERESLSEVAPLADALQPEVDLEDEVGEMSQPPAPIGAEGVFESSPPLGSFSGLPVAPDELVSVPSVPPQAAVVTVEPRRGLSVGALAMIVAVAVFSGVLAFLAFDRFGNELLNELLGASRAAQGGSRVNPAGPTPQVPTPQAVAEPKASVDETASEEAAAEEGEQSIEGQDSETSEGEPLEDETADGETQEGETLDGEGVEATQADLFVEPPNPVDDAPRIAPAKPRKPRARRSSQPKPVAAAPASKSLSMQDRKLLDDFGSSADTATAPIQVKESGSTQSKNPPLDGDAVRATVTANKPRLQRCYERAIRGQQSPPSVRLDVTVNVAASGRVKSVSAVGSGPGGLPECIEASVRRWRFPASAEGGPAKFPIVFSGN